MKYKNPRLKEVEDQAILDVHKSKKNALDTNNYSHAADIMPEIKESEERYAKFVIDLFKEAKKKGLGYREYFGNKIEETCGKEISLEMALYAELVREISFKAGEYDVRLFLINNLVKHPTGRVYLMSESSYKSRFLVNPLKNNKLS